MSENEIRAQIASGAAIVKGWPAWKQNILTHSSQSTNSTARAPVSNQPASGDQAGGRR